MVSRYKPWGLLIISLSAKLCCLVFQIIVYKKPNVCPVPMHIYIYIYILSPMYWIPYPALDWLELRDKNNSSRPLTPPLTSFYADIEEGGGVSNRGGRSKRLAIGWDSMDRKRPRRGG